MSYEQFWYGNPKLVIAYREAHKLKIEQVNQQLWLQGLYIHNAVGVLLANMFKSKGATPEKYMEQPIDLFHREKTESEKVEQRNKVIQSLSMFQSMWKQKGK